MDLDLSAFCFLSLSLDTGCLQASFLSISKVVEMLCETPGIKEASEIFSFPLLSALLLSSDTFCFHCSKKKKKKFIVIHSFQSFHICL